MGRGRPIDLTGKTFGKLTVLERAGQNKNRNALWKCQCECGLIKITSGRLLRNGDSKSCGCLRLDSCIKTHTIHGMSKSPEFAIWAAMIQRCQNPKNIGYKDYGGRGITICERWLNSFENFFIDMGPKPEKHSIDRINNDRGYSPENCRWATCHEQRMNQRPKSKNKKTG